MTEVTIDKTIVIEDVGSISELRCPRCAGQYLHQLNVVVFDRAEDASHVIRTTVEGGTSRTDVVPNAGSGNPSARRDGLSILFWCEGCDAKRADPIELTIAQHKGCTEIGWRYRPAAKFIASGS
jgi:hypothetical protein